MKLKSKFKTFGMALAISLFGFSCSPDTQNETNEVIDETQTDLNQANVETRRELNEFSRWVDTNTARADTLTADEYREMRAEYKRREAELERESAEWDAETRRAWEETKADWNRFENKVRDRLGNIEGIDVDVDVQRENR